MIAAFNPEVVRRVEQNAVQAVADAGHEGVLMRRAAHAVADAVRSHLKPGGCVSALVGGGDNGGDAVFAAAELANEGVRVKALLFSDHPHVEGVMAAEAAGVLVRTCAQQPAQVGNGNKTRIDAADSTDSMNAADLAQTDWLVADVWIDGILGAGLKSPLRQPLAGMIDTLNAVARRHGVRVIAVDVPSGLYQADGSVDGPVLKAAHTVTMIAAKTGLVLPPAAWNAGRIQVADLEAGVTLPKPAVVTPDPAHILESLVIPGPADHKYTRGVVGVVAGSATYPGAGVLAVDGALSTGPGMVRLDSDPAVQHLVLSRHPAVVVAAGRVQATLVGSGLDDSMAARAKAHAVQALEHGTPLVLDAGALKLIKDLPTLIPSVVLTPHAGEAAALLSELTGKSVSRVDVDARPLASASALVEHTRATVVLKGARTLIVGQHGPVIVVNQAPGWAGVAGSGDVLAGIIAGILAQQQAKAENNGRSALTDSEVLAATAGGVWLHDQAASLASGTIRSGEAIRADGPRHPGHPIEPQDIAAAVPGLIGSLLDASRAVEVFTL